MLVPPAPKLAMRDVPGVLKRINVRPAKEPAHGDCHQIKRGSRGDSEARGHAFRVANPAYESVAANLGNLSPRYRVLFRLNAHMIGSMDELDDFSDFAPNNDRCSDDGGDHGNPVCQRYRPAQNDRTFCCADELRSDC